MKILLIANRILFFLSFFLPFVLLPHCEGPAAEEKEEKFKAIQDSIRLCDSANHAYQVLTTDTSITNNNADTTRSTSNLTEHSDTTVTKKERKNVFIRIHESLQSPTQNSISGYGIALVSFDRDIKGFIPFVLLFSFMLSIAGLFMLFARKGHISQTLLSVFSLLFLIIFLFMALSDHISIHSILWGFWASLFLCLTNVIITIIIKRKYTSR